MKSNKSYTTQHKKEIKLKVISRRFAPSTIHGVKVSLYSYFFKRLIDFTFALFALIVLYPFLLIIYFITIFTSKGSGLYYQPRIGFNGEQFYIFKFRSMKYNSEGDVPKLVEDNDDRLTKWGKFMRRYYLDELPQLLNILRGDMSIVGPRPERQYFINKIIEKNEDFYPLLQVKPGLTSLGQIRFGYAQNVSEMIKRLKYEQLYLKKISFKTDLKIVLSTFVSVAKAKGK